MTLFQQEPLAKKEEPLIAARNLSFSYHDSPTPALREINLTVSKGEFIGITGPTGAGKTTLAHCLNGVIPHFVTGDYFGDVAIEGRSVFDLTGRELSRRVGSVFQDPEAQLVSAGVEEELAFGPENLGFEPDEIERRIDFALQAVRIPHLRKASIAGLSGGQKQRVAIAAVLAMRPDILILDEPTAELDPLGTDDVFAVLRQLNVEYGITVIIVEHKMEHLAEYCRRLLVLEEGRIRIDGTPADVFSDWFGIKELGVRLPQVTEFFGNLPEEFRSGTRVPVTLEQTTAIIRRFFINPEKDGERQ